MPTYALDRTELEKGVLAVHLFADSGICDSRSAARRMARQKGLYVQGDSIPEDRVLTADDLQDGTILLRAGKKKYMKIIVE